MSFFLIIVRCLPKKHLGQMCNEFAMYAVLTVMKLESLICEQITIPGNL